MFFDRFEKRIASWHDFRDQLENIDDPIQAVIDLWNKAPISSMTCDPYDQSTWPDPWQLIESNKFCEFSKILAIYYTLSLTDRFSNHKFEIWVAHDIDNQVMFYLLIVNGIVIGYDRLKSINIDDLPYLKIQQKYNLKPINE